MARVTIDTTAQIAAKKLAHDMKWDRYKAIGVLYFFWHDSQAVEQDECSIEDICIWLGLKTETAKKFAKSLVRSRFLKEIGDNFKIIGNEKHINAIRQRKEASRNNGKFGGRPEQYQRSNENDAKPKPNLAANPTDNLPENHSAVQRSTVQSSTVHKNNNTARATRANDNPNFEAQKVAEGDWQETLKFFQAERKTVMPHERKSIADAIRRHGLIPVRYAIVGCRFEAKTPTFDPKKNLQMRRVFDPKNFDKFVNLGSQENNKSRPHPAKPELTVIPFEGDP